MNMLMTHCGDGSFYCLLPRSAAALVAIINLISCASDTLTSSTLYPVSCGAVCPLSGCELSEYVESVRHHLGAFFVTANMLLLLASIVENSMLVQIYVWYTLGFVIMALALTLVDFLMRFRQEGASRSLAVFVPDVALLFVMFRCLPLVDAYRKHIDSIPSRFY